MIQLQWIGGPTFILECGPFRLLSDPMFGEGKEAFIMYGHPSTGEEVAPICRRADLPKIDIKSIDSVIISHLHADHFDQVASDMLCKQLPVIAPASQVGAIQKRGFTNIEGLEWWEEVVLKKKQHILKIIAVPARHAHEDTLNEEMGIVNGYIIEYQHNDCIHKIYWTGDTVWFHGFEEIKERMGRVNVLLAHIGAVGVDGPYGRLTLDAKEAVRVLQFFEPDVMIPIHHHTFSHYVEPVSVLEKEVKNTPYASHLCVLHEGEIWRSGGCASVP